MVFSNVCIRSMTATTLSRSFFEDCRYFSCFLNFAEMGRFVPFFFVNFVSCQYFLPFQQCPFREFKGSQLERTVKYQVLFFSIGSFLYFLCLFFDDSELNLETSSPIFCSYPGSSESTRRKNVFLTETCEIILQDGFNFCTIFSDRG